MNSEHLINLKFEKLNEWNTTKKNLSKDFIEQSDSIPSKFNQGDIIWCNLGENIGREISKTRPVIIVSVTKINNSSNIVVVPLSTKIRFRKRNGKNYVFATQYILKAKNYDFLEKDAVAKCEQITRVSTARFKEQIKLGQLNNNDLEGVKRACARIFEEF